MKTALVLGGTGLVGQSLITQLLQDPSYAKVRSLLRKPMNITNPKLVQIKFDFDNPDTAAISGDEVFCCLGTTMKISGSKETFYKVDHDYVVKTAALAVANGIKKFAFVSSIGADKNASIFYSKVKGETEHDLSQMKFSSLYIFRPSALLGNRSEFRLGEHVAKWFMTNLSFLLPKKYNAIEASQVAHAMIKLMQSAKPGVHILESEEIASI